MTAIPRAKVRQRLTAFPFSSPALRRRQSKAPVHSAVRSGNHGGRNDGPLPGREHPGRQGQAPSKVAAPWCSRPRSMLSPAITYNAKSVCGSRAAGRPPKEEGNVRTWESRICRMSVHKRGAITPPCVGSKRQGGSRRSVDAVEASSEQIFGRSKSDAGGDDDRD